MSRPLTGSLKQVKAGWRASLPVEHGSTTRLSHTFCTEEIARTWLAAACEARTARRPLPSPSDDALVGRSTGTKVRPIAEEWLAEYYEELGRGGVARQTTVAAHIKRIAEFMDAHDLVLEKMVRDKVKAFQASLTRRRTAGPSVAVPAHLDPDELVTLTDAVQLPNMASRSTLKRRIDDGLLVAAGKKSSAHLYRIADLYCEAVLGAEGSLRPGPKTGGVLSQEVASDVMWVFEEVCAYAIDHGIEVPQDRASLKMHLSEAGDRQARRPITTADCALLAGEMHSVHQLALWLMRTLGLRIGEAYGVLVRDVIDHGPDHPGVLLVNAQGGKNYKRRTTAGSYETTSRTEDLKTKNSRRVLVVPPMMMEMIRVVVAVFHTDAEGCVRSDARLIPGLSTSDTAGQSGFRTALARAARTHGIQHPLSPASDRVDALLAVPHDLRRSVLSDLNRMNIKDTHIQRFAGHVSGPDVVHRYYYLDDPELVNMREIAMNLEAHLRTEVPEGLKRPTRRRCTTGWQGALAADARRIDAELTERGWLIPASGSDGDTMLSAAEAARHLGVSDKTAREWMKNGRLLSVAWTERANGTERRSRLSDVMYLAQQLRDRTTLRVIAEEVEQSYHTVYQFVRAHPQDLPLEPWGANEYLIPEESAQKVREHYARQRRLHDRAVPLSVAASILTEDVAVIRRLVERGELIEDERAHDGRRMITRASVSAVESSRPYLRRDKSPEPVVEWREVITTTGLSDAELSALVAEGRLERVERKRRRHITRASYLLYLAQDRPDLLAVGGLM